MKNNRSLFVQAKENASPKVRKMVRTYLIVYLAIILSLLIPVLVLLGLDENKYMPTLYVWIALVLAGVVIMLFVQRAAVCEQAKFCMEKYAYLFQSPRLFDEKTLTVKADGAVYTVTADGVKVEWAVSEDVTTVQVFDEVKENVHFVAWIDAYFALATVSEPFHLQPFYRLVHIALAVLPEEQTGEGIESDPLILPMSEALFSAMHTFGVMEKLQADWAYLFYNPQDAFKQILQKGLIVKMRNKKTGKVFVDEKGNFIP